MKIRIGFVSNSSSSSFVVICNDEKTLLNKEDTTHPFHNKTYGSFIKIPTHFYNSKLEFGWGPEKVTDIESKINFAYLQCKDADNDEWLSILEEIIREELEVEEIIWNIAANYRDKGIEGYIDHQSSASEGQNTEIFDSKEVLKNFLFNKNSYIQLDNDNHD